MCSRFVNDLYGSRASSLLRRPNRHIFNFEGRRARRFTSYQSSSGRDFSYWNLLDAIEGENRHYHPLIAGPINSPQIFFYKHPDLGPEFLKRLYGETNMTIVRADDQIMDWLSLGKFPLAFGGRDVDKAIVQGLPVNQFAPGHMKEGASLAAYNGTLSFFNRAPHPNAAKVAINWLLSKEGQSAWLDSNAKTFGQYDSLREDISKDKVADLARRTKGQNICG